VASRSGIRVNLERRVEVVTAVLRESLPADLAEERARNIVQALVDEPEGMHPSIREIHREEVVRNALVFWRFAPDGWFASLELRVQILKALEAT